MAAAFGGLDILKNLTLGTVSYLQHPEGVNS
jgi:hypothetical protein